MEGNFPQAGPARYEVLVPAPLCRREDASRRRVARWMTPEMRTNARSEWGLLMERASGRGGEGDHVRLGCLEEGARVAQGKVSDVKKSAVEGPRTGPKIWTNARTPNNQLCQVLA